MTIKEKVMHASANEIYLYKEGLFWVAYEQSAFFFWKLKGYKPTKKYIKKIQKEIVSIGFPNSVLLSLISQNKLILVDDYNQDLCNRYSFILDSPIENDIFENWKNNLNVIKTDINKRMTIENETMMRIKIFPLAYKTPIEAFLFLKDIQENLP